ncbi:phage virion morphogenesis protein [Janthinobacterium violaceinigrum]|nr:phage virion morphogenesis protein [Janthinobacterium violaceinigrum]
MSDDLHTLATWAGALVAKRRPAQRRAINHKVAIDLRSASRRSKGGWDGLPGVQAAQGIQGQEWADQAAESGDVRQYAHRKHLEVKTTGDQIEVGFFGWVARVARVHQFGQRDRVTQKGPTHKYLEQPLLGLNDQDRTLVLESLLHHIRPG